MAHRHEQVAAFRGPDRVPRELEARRIAEARHRGPAERRVSCGVFLGHDNLSGQSVTFAAAAMGHDRRTSV